MKLFLSLFLFLFFAHLPAEIVEIKYISELNKHVSDKTLILLNLDDTIMQPVQELGSYCWLEHRFQKYEKGGLSSFDAMEKALSEWMAVQCITHMKLVESHTAALIKDLQDKGYSLMGLTPRTLGFAGRSIAQLHSIGVHLEKTPPAKEELYFPNGQTCLYRQGILFAATSHKGDALKKFFEEIHQLPKKVVFLSDRSLHLKQVEEFCKEKKIPFVGLRYSHLDEKMKNFRSDVADLQFEKFTQILSDNDAVKLISDAKL